MLFFHFDENGRSSCHTHHLRVADPAGGGNNHLVAGIEKGLEKGVERVLGSVGNDDFLRVVMQAVIFLKTMNDRVLQFGSAADGGIAGHILIHGFLHSVTDRQGRIEIGFSGGKADHADALSLQGLGLGVHGKSGGRSDSPCFFRNRAGHNENLPRQAKPEYWINESFLIPSCKIHR